MNDKKILDLQREALDFSERQKALKKEKEEYFNRLQNEFRDLSKSIEKYKDILRKLKISSNSIKAKRLLLRMIVIPAIAIPLS